MRLMIEFTPLSNFGFDYVDKHKVQSFIYYLLRGSDYDDLHKRSGFKFFCFSDIFPIGDFVVGERKRLIVSSPDSDFIDALAEGIVDNDFVFELGSKGFEVVDLKKFDLEPNGVFISGSPVVLHIDNRRSLYFTMRRKPDIMFFLERVKDNALKKFNAFYGSDFFFEGPIFDKLVFKKDVATVFWKDGKKITVLGTVWEELSYVRNLRRDGGREFYKFYKFILDAGLGEKNSLGFGFLNPKKIKKRT